MALALLVICSVSAWNGLQVKSLTERELAVAQSVLLQSTTLRFEMQRQDVAIRNVGLDADPVRMQVQGKVARAAAKNAEAAFEKLLAAPQSAKDAATLEELRKLNQSTTRVAENALGQALSFLPDEAVKMINDTLEPLSAKRGELLAAYEAEKRQRAEQAMADISALSLHALIVTSATGLGGLVAAVLCAWFVSRSISRPMHTLVSAANRLADGDLTVEFSGSGKSEMAVLAGALRRMSANLREVIGTVRQSAQGTHTASAEIASGNRDLSERTERQAASLQESTSTVADLAGAVQRNAESADQARALAAQATDVAKDGGLRVGDVATTMAEIAHSSQRIGEIVSVIDGIAFQTNILALNAAVEAARAGDQGRGFAVVATEVRALSKRSSVAAKEIRALIEANTTKVEGGSRQVSAAAATMQEVVRSSAKLAELVAEISSVSTSQASSLAAVSQSISLIDGMTQQNAALVEQAAASATSLEQQTLALNETVLRFRTDDAT